MRKRELKRFAIIGVLTVMIDFIVYNLILVSTSSHILSKAVGFCLGAMFSYRFNKMWTFSMKKTRAMTALRYYAVYIIGLTLNVCIYHLAIVSITIEVIDRNYIAFIMATAVSASSNFLLAKYMVFREKRVYE